MPIYRLTIEYDRTKFSGWQVQRRGRTAQGVLLDVLRRVFGAADVTLRGAGRTDAGVHALARVASLECARRLSVTRLAADLARELPADLAVWDWLAGTAQPPADAAPAAGLFLERVVYPGEREELPLMVPIGVPWSPLGRSGPEAIEAAARGSASRSASRRRGSGRSAS